MASLHHQEHIPYTDPTTLSFLELFYHLLGINQYISYFQSGQLHTRNYYKGYTAMLVQEGKYMLYENKGTRTCIRKQFAGENLRFFDPKLAADDPRSLFSLKDEESILKAQKMRKPKK